MSLILNIVQVVQLLSALGMIGLILVQHGKGADMGAAFGSGSSGSLFGASGGANFLSRTTGVLAAVFFVCTLAPAVCSKALWSLLRRWWKCLLLGQHKFQRSNRKTFAPQSEWGPFSG
jgi:protein translocase SecG subunit